MEGPNKSGEVRRGRMTPLAPTSDRSSTTRWMTRVGFVCLSSLAVNAVLIQTVLAENSSAKNGVRIFVVALVAIAIVFGRPRLPMWIVLLSLCSAVLLLARDNPDQLSYLFVLVLVPVLRCVRERDLSRIFVGASLTSLLLIFFLLAAGMTQNEILMPRFRNTFGTASVPFFFNVVYGCTTLLVLHAFNYRLRSRWVLTAIATALATYFFQATDIRGGYFAYLGFLLLMIAVPHLKTARAAQLFLALLPAFFLAAAFYLAGLGDDPDANVLLSYRPALYQAFLESLSLSDIFFSTSVKQFDSSATSIVDNSYLHLLVGGGLIMCVTYVTIYAAAVLNLFRAHRFNEIAFLTATSVYFNAESALVRIENIFVIFSWFLVINNCRRPAREESVQP